MGVEVRGVSKYGLQSKLKLKMQLFDSLTGPSTEYGTWVTANAYEPLVFVNIKIEVQTEYLIILTTLKERYNFCKYD